MTYLHKPTILTTAPAQASSPADAAARLGVPAGGSHAPAHVEVAAWRYDNLEVALDTEHRCFWAWQRPTGRPSYTMALMQDISAMQFAIQRLFAERAAGGEKPFDWFVMGSRVPGIFNLGGDLGLFGELIRKGDLESLRHYGHVAVEAIHRNHTAFDVPVITLALVQGDALGGGFECALSYDLIVAEKSAKLGLPEILFNMFPGMGAVSFLSRRLDRVRAEKLITSGKIYTAEELHEMGVVDVLAEDGMGEATVEEFIERNARKHNALYHMQKARRRANPITLEELRDVVDLWAEAAVNLTEPDLRKMARLTAAQDRRIASLTPAAPAMAAE
ncbi:crotonase/enoyl-CoA hydratase family protein [Caldovatus aquaticus]|uniref:Crotonase/enoyl-CoA hydratase family protein n=1 Tax=Caldovatus aquaticus TaxID=2865671 RepID=A0ABS7F7N6_9PROT|nr:crotonase/enoyl-CoA hydratase family protein [Caldovatus aquaticus]MBW8270846.1 crotonase/enoyl-CoA hydratase family protein [Caldovatus aquaticus]